MILAQEVASTVLAPYEFSPSTITNPPLAIWFDASDINSISSSTNNTIGLWSNKAFPNEFLRRSSNSVVGTSSNTNSAITGVHTLFGKNVAWFSTGSEMFIQKILNQTGISMSLFMVMVPLTGPSPTNPSTLLFGAPRNLNVFTHTIVYNNATSQYNFEIRRGSTNITLVRVTDQSFPLDQPYLISMINSTTSNSNVIALNGLNYQQRNPSVNASGYTTGNSNMFVNYASFSTSFDLAELIVYNGIIRSSNDRQRIEGYLAWKWGLNYDNFWNGHPFKFVTPLS
jgi:hypothetical protein